jgi:hypothetical protein
VDEAVASGRLIPIVRAVWRVGISTVVGFVGAFVLFFGYLIPFCLLSGSVLLALTHRGARRFLAWWRGRRAGFAVSAGPALS